MTDIQCPCGETHRFSRPELQTAVDSMVAKMGREIPVTVGGGERYLVDRYYIAFHGFKAAEAEELVRKGIIKKAD